MLDTVTDENLYEPAPEELTNEAIGVIVKLVAPEHAVVHVTP
jgi:hypothetical protein